MSTYVDWINGEDADKDRWRPLFESLDRAGVAGDALVDVVGNLFAVICTCPSCHKDWSNLDNFPVQSSNDVTDSSLDHCFHSGCVKCFQRDSRKLRPKCKQCDPAVSLHVVPDTALLQLGRSLFEYWEDEQPVVTAVDGAPVRGCVGGG